MEQNLKIIIIFFLTYITYIFCRRIVVFLGLKIIVVFIIVMYNPFCIY